MTVRIEENQKVIDVMTSMGDGTFSSFLLPQIYVEENGVLVEMTRDEEGKYVHQDRSVQVSLNGHASLDKGLTKYKFSRVARVRNELCFVWAPVNFLW